MAQPNKINYNIIGLKINKISSFPKLYNDKDSNFNTEINLGIGIKSQKDNSFIMRTKVSIIQSTNTISFIDVTCIVGIVETDWQLLINNKIITIPNEFIHHIFSYIFNIASGALLLKNKNNVLSEFFLPPQVFSFINEDYVYDFNKKAKTKKIDKKKD
ncbi:MAG: hypothetical protein LBJ63_02590 [Prevotellaceae bacterium]|jgi:hypothetical protein|nr:hypothetical protein [Prevotellaceae bacterium]